MQGPRNPEVKHICHFEGTWGGLWFGTAKGEEGSSHGDGKENVR